jgi:CRP/FNR family transcriptional regulator, cyclic AMP receptor protein
MQLQSLIKSQSDFFILDAGQTLFEEGEPGKAMFVVISGELDIFVRGINVESVGPDGLIGELALIDGTPRAAKVVARTNAKLLSIDLVRFLALTRQEPEFPLLIMRAISERLKRVGKLL